MKILVVDDHALIREALRGVLKEVKGDASVLEASDCRQAMQLIAAHADLSLILLDLTLPDRDGFSVRREIGIRPRHAGHIAKLHRISNDTNYGDRIGRRLQTANKQVSDR